MKIISLFFAFVIAIGGSMLQAADWYVDANAGRDDSPLYDGTSPDTAKKTLAAVFAISDIQAGDIVHAAPGNYNEGVMWDGALSNRVVVAAGVGLVADGGRAVTTITGAPDPTTDGRGANATRCVYLKSGAWIKGFKITGGYTSALTSTDKSCYSGGVYTHNAGVGESAIVDCEITGNFAHRGAAAYHSSLFRCYVHNNTSNNSSEKYPLMGCNYIYSSVVCESKAIYGNSYCINCYLDSGVMGNSDNGNVYRAFNSYVKTDSGVMAYTNCVLGSTKLASGSIGDESNKFDQTPSIESGSFRPTANSILHNTGDRALYDNYFPAAWKRFKEPFDFAGGARMCGSAIDIGAGEFQEARIGSGTLFNLQGTRERPPRKVAVAGKDIEVNTLAATAMEATRVLYDTYLSASGGIPVTNYKNYAAIFIVCDTSMSFSDEARWNTPARLAAAQAYVREGGILVLGYGAASLFAAESDEAWQFVHSGRVVIIDRGIYELQKYYNDKGIELGEADEDGNWAMSAAGEYLDSITRAYVDVCANLTELQATHDTDPFDYGTEPLGGNGTRTQGSTTLPNPSCIKAAATKMYDFPEGVVVYDKDNGIKAKIVAKVTNHKKLANEIKYHLDRMTGESFEVVANAPSAGNYIQIKNDNTLTTDAVSIAITSDGRGWVITGSDKHLGASHAVTFLLESLGCRYLWPGELGKVIPKNQTRLVAPEVNLTNHTPKFEYRRWIKAYKCGGVNAIKDDSNNRSFNQWHGIDSTSPYATDHYFDDFYKKYYADHPEWFALQADGKRHLVKGKEDRAVLCLSNADLRQETARVIASEMGTATPTAVGTLNNRYHVITLADAGGGTQCLCSNCRRLDYANAPAINMVQYFPYSKKFQYVSLTDRVLDFQNSVAQQVKAMYSGEDLWFTVYVYSFYLDPPMQVTPDPSLVLFNVGGSYTSQAAMNKFRANIANWHNSFPDNRWVWRPNAFITYQVAMPKNYAREYYEDVQLFKANGARGLYADNVFDTFAGMGLNYYAVAKSYMDFDPVPYEVLLKDYCEKGFGAAADDIEGYFNALENIWRETKDDTSGVDKIYVYVDKFAVQQSTLEGYLSSALAKVASDSEEYTRIQFLQKAMPYARQEKLLADARRTSSAALKTAKANFNAFLSETTEDSLVYEHADFSEHASTRWTLHK